MVTWLMANTGETARDTAEEINAGSIFTAFSEVAQGLGLSVHDVLAQAVKSLVSPAKTEEVAKSVSDSVAALIVKAADDTEKTIAADVAEKMDAVTKSVDALSGRIQTVEKVSGVSQSVEGQETSTGAPKGGVFTGILSGVKM